MEKSTKQKEMYNIEIDINEALSTEFPIEQLTLIANKLYKKGFSNQDIYTLFLKYDMTLEDNNDKKNTLEDFMDMITNWYVGKNIDLSE